jgi:HSP20 family protein
MSAYSNARSLKSNEKIAAFPLSFLPAFFLIFLNCQNRYSAYVYATDGRQKEDAREVPMDPFSKKMLEELEQMQQQAGRMLRRMSLSRMMPMEPVRWQPAVDVYEAENSVYVYAELAGVDNDTLQVLVDDQRLHLSGMRQLPSHPSIACIHQLEIELGAFERTVTLPSAVEVDQVESAYANGILVVTLPKRQKQSRVTIRIESGE